MIQEPSARPYCSHVRKRMDDISIHLRNHPTNNHNPTKRNILNRSPFTNIKKD
jgi:hypothetical protein